MTDQGLIDILPGKLFHVYNVDKTAKLINLLKFMIVSYALSAAACIILAIDDESHMLE